MARSASAVRRCCTRYDMTIAVQARVVPREGRVNFIESVLEHVLNLEG